jgi:hypothetical protein
MCLYDVYSLISPDHIPIKCRGPIKKTSHSTPNSSRSISLRFPLENMTSISVTKDEDLTFLFLLYRCLHVRDDYSKFKIQTLKFYYVGDYNRNVNSGLEGQQFEIKSKLVF